MPPAGRLALLLGVSVTSPAVRFSDLLWVGLAPSAVRLALLLRVLVGHRLRLPESIEGGERRPRDPLRFVGAQLVVGGRVGRPAGLLPASAAYNSARPDLRGIGCTSVRFRAKRTHCSAFASAWRYRHPSGRFVYRRTTSASLRASRTASRTDLEGKGMTVAVISRPPPTSLSTIATRRRKCR
jgi:hypothetical protein